jgi:outer membrane biosynthesis protein TonB
MTRLAILSVVLFAFNASAESLTTTNVLPPLADFSTSGSTTSSAGSGCSAGEFCTGNASNGGGTYTSSFDVPLTESEIRRGFTLNSSSLVYAHPSNATVQSCVSITQGPDCRDIFELEISLFDGSTIQEQFLHQVELDFSGERLFKFTDTVAANNFGPLTGTLSLFGIDAGFFSKFFGPKFSEPALSIDYEKLFEQQITEQITIPELFVAEISAPPAPIAELTIEQPPSAPPPPAVTLASFDSSAPQEPEPPAPPAPPAIQVSAPQQQQEIAAVAQVEEQMELDVEQADQEQTEPQTRQDKVKAAVEKVVARIAPSQRYSAASQTTMIIAMGLLAPPFATKIMEDTPGFFTAARIPDALSMVNRMQNYTYRGQSNGAHEALVQLDWAR